MTDYLTTTGAAGHITEQQGHEVLGWQVRRAYETREMPEPVTRAGQYRLIAREDLPALAEALRRMGYLPSRAGTAAPAVA